MENNADSLQGKDTLPNHQTETITLISQEVPLHIDKDAADILERGQVEKALVEIFTAINDTKKLNDEYQGVTPLRRKQNPHYNAQVEGILAVKGRYQESDSILTAQTVALAKLKASGRLSIQNKRINESDWERAQEVNANLAQVKDFITAPLSL